MINSVKDFNDNYPYTKDPRDMQLNLENHTYWEEDNRVEERYQWGAMVVDLCDLPVEEYMKNPMVDIMSSATSDISNKIDEVNDNVKEATTKLSEEIEESTDRIIDAIQSGKVGTVHFYYASINSQTSSDNITFDMFEKRSAAANTIEPIHFVMGSPTEEDIAYVESKGYSDEAKREIMAKRANTYYMIIPERYNRADAISVKENGISDQESDIVRNMPMVDCPDGYALMGVVDDDNFNPDWTTDTVKIEYDITFINNNFFFKSNTTCKISSNNNMPT